MRVLVTGSAGHLGEALMRTLPAAGYEAGGARLPSALCAYTSTLLTTGAEAKAVTSTTSLRPSPVTSPIAAACGHAPTTGYAW
jgi:dTDP-4-dehydrorhamnose reductase